MFVDDPKVCQLLQGIVRLVTTETCLHDDLYQDATLHLFVLETNHPGQTRSWYLQRCKRYLQDLLNRGRSLDSPKRHSLQVQLEDEFEDEYSQGEWLSIDGQILSSVSAHDLRDQISRQLSSTRARATLVLLEKGLDQREIASELPVSQQAVSKLLPPIRAAALLLGFHPPGAQPGPSQQSR